MKPILLTHTLGSTRLVPKKFDIVFFLFSSNVWLSLSFLPSFFFFSPNNQQFNLLNWISRKNFPNRGLYYTSIIHSQFSKLCPQNSPVFSRVLCLTLSLLLSSIFIFVCVCFSVSNSLFHFLIEKRCQISSFRLFPSSSPTCISLFPPTPFIRPTIKRPKWNRNRINTRDTVSYLRNSGSLYLKVILIGFRGLVMFLRTKFRPQV